MTTETTSVVTHRTFSAFGERLSQKNVTNPQAAAVDCVFGFTGRLYDEATGLQNNWNRWYDAKTGQWISKDPIALTAGDANIYRYVANKPVTSVDSMGLAEGGGSWTDYINPFAWFRNTRDKGIELGDFWGSTLSPGLAQADYNRKRRESIINNVWQTQNGGASGWPFSLQEIDTGDGGRDAIGRVLQMPQKTYETIEWAVEVAAWVDGVAGAVRGLASDGVAQTFRALWGDTSGGARLPKLGTPERNVIEAARKKGIALKQAQELKDIRAGGNGSGVWSEGELQQIRSTGRFPKDAKWHHDPTVANRPDLAADPNVVHPIRGGREGHFWNGHQGDWRKPY